MGEHAIGTTARGIGPAYEIKASRVGLRMCDLTAADLEERLDLQLRRLFPEITTLCSSALPTWGRRPRTAANGACASSPTCATPPAARTRRSTTGEGGALRGRARAPCSTSTTAPIPTSPARTSTAGGAAVGTGVGPTRLDGVIGVLKAYTTRVGKGPVPDRARRRDGRAPARPGPRVRHHHRPSPALRLARSRGGALRPAAERRRLDRADQARRPRRTRRDQALRRLPRRRRRAHRLPSRADDFESATPIYRTVPGWTEPTVGITDFDDLPQAARDYVQLLEDRARHPGRHRLHRPQARRDDPAQRSAPHRAHRRAAGGLGKAVTWLRCLSAPGGSVAGGREKASG